MNDEPGQLGDDAKPETARSRLRKALPTILGTFAYMIPVFILWDRVDYPDSLGVNITAHGKAGVIESWWYSYLLVQRGRPWDLITFGYMWLPLVAGAALIANKFYLSRRRPTLEV